MTRATKFFVSGFLIFFFLSSVASQDDEVGDTLRYRFENVATYTLKPGSNMTTLKFSGDGHLTPVNKERTVLSMVVTDAVLTVQTENGKVIDLSQCVMKKKIDDLNRPFLAEFTEDGLLQHIKVNNDETELAVNFKLYAASVFQINVPQMTGESPATEQRDELTYLGTCPVKNELLQQNGDEYQARFSGDLTQCNEIKSDHSSDQLSCLSHSCRNTGDKNLKFDFDMNSDIKKMDGQYVVEKMQLNQKFTYNPFLDTEDEFEFNLDAKTTLVEKAKDKDIPLFHEGETETVTGPRYVKVNEDICNAEDASDDKKQLYSALVCQQSVFIAEDMLERAIECEA